MSLDILINGVVFKEINQRFFVVYGKEDKFPFLQSVLYDDDDNFPTAKFGNFPRREYKSIFIDGKFYAPTFNTKKK